jgi:hypothetical protein
MKSMLLGLSLTFITLGAYSQVNPRDSSISMVLISPSFAVQKPWGDMKDRFGNNSSVALEVAYKSKKGWMAGVQGAFIFGSKVVQNDLYSHLITSQGEIIGTDGKYSDIRVFERGYAVTVNMGYLFAMKKPNPNSGFFVNAGAGFLQHKIRIEDKLSVTPALQGDYKKGYDHLSNGLCVKESAGYIYLGNRRLVNFFIAVEALEGFTKGRRTYDFDLEKPANEKRTDILTGIRVGWTLPLYKAAPEKFYMD